MIILISCFVVEKERPPSGKVRPLPPEENLDCNMPVPRHCETTLYQARYFEHYLNKIFIWRVILFRELS